MSLSLSDSQVINEIAQQLYDFLPGNPHPYADQSISFAGIAKKLELGLFWRSGSKLPSLTTLLESTLDLNRGKFCDLVLEIVRKGLIYRNSKGNPIKREEIRRLNELLTHIKFKIPDLVNPEFLETLPSILKEKPSSAPQITQSSLNYLKTQLIDLSKLNSTDRGFAFEKYLTQLFSLFNLAPRGPFRLIGEQIDGSFQLGPDTYLVEAKWQEKQVSQADLLVFRGKVEGKATWSRGLFISYSGFTEEGIEAFSKGRSTNIIGMNSQDIFFILEGEMTLTESINAKARCAAETGDFFISIFELMR
jgi:hypothetical protein